MPGKLFTHPCCGRSVDVDPHLLNRGRRRDRLMRDYAPHHVDADAAVKMRSYSGGFEASTG